MVVLLKLRNRQVVIDVDIEIRILIPDLSGGNPRLQGRLIHPYLSLRELIGIIVDVNVGPGITGNTYLGCSVTVDVDHDRIIIGCPSLANNLSKGNASLS